MVAVVFHTALAALAFAPGMATEPASASRVVIASLHGSFAEIAWPAAEERLVLELSMRGFGVERVVARGANEVERRRELERLATERQAVAAVCISLGVTDHSTELWVFDRVTGKTSYRRLAPTLVRSTESASTAALRAVELLYASLLESRLAHESRGALVAPGDVDKALDRMLPANPESRAFSVGLGLFALRLSSRMARFVGPQLQGAFRLNDNFELALGGFASALGEEIQRPQATTDLSVAGLRLSGAWTPVPAATVSWWLGAEIGFLAIATSGHTALSMRAERESEFTAMPGLAVGAVWHLSPALQLQSALHGAMPVPRSRVYVEEIPVARLASVAWAADVALQVRL